MPYLPEYYTDQQFMQPNAPWDITIRGVEFLGLVPGSQAIAITHEVPPSRLDRAHMVLADYVEAPHVRGRKPIESIAAKYGIDETMRSLKLVSRYHQAEENIPQAYAAALKAGYITAQESQGSEGISPGTRLVTLRAIGRFPRLPPSAPRENMLEALRLRASGMSWQEMSDSSQTPEATLDSRVDKATRLLDGTNPTNAILLAYCLGLLPTAEAEHTHRRHISTRAFGTALLAAAGLKNEVIGTQLAVNSGAVRTHLRRASASLGQPSLNRHGLAGVLIAHNYLGIDKPDRGQQPRIRPT